MSEWIRRGPELRAFTSPDLPRSRLTGEDLPRAVIPIAFRNDYVSRELIATGQLADPWPGAAAQAGDPMLGGRQLLAMMLGTTRTDPQTLDAEVTAAVQRRAAGQQWDYVVAFAETAGGLGLRAVVPVLCDLLPSCPDPVPIIDTLALLGGSEAVPALVGRLGGEASRRCLYAIYAIGTPEAHRTLADIANGQEWPDELRQLARQLA
ncbi:hypothetical protein ACFQX7_12335 [Luedemannella flava]